MKVVAHPQRLPGVQLLELESFGDHRGFFYESYSQRSLAGIGIDLTFVQDNHSRSADGVIRGLHYQAPDSEQWRLVRCTVGAIFDVLVDIQEVSPTFGQWQGFDLSADNRHQLLIPPHYAHGFAVVSGPAEVQYKCSAPHDAAAERALNYADPGLAIAWPLSDPITSEKDAHARPWSEYVSDPDFPAGGTR